MGIKAEHLRTYGSRGASDPKVSQNLFTRHVVWSQLLSCLFNLLVNESLPRSAGKRRGDWDPLLNIRDHITDLSIALSVGPSSNGFPPLVRSSFRRSNLPGFKSELDNLLPQSNPSIRHRQICVFLSLAISRSIRQTLLRQGGVEPAVGNVDLTVGLLGLLRPGLTGTGDSSSPLSKALYPSALGRVKGGKLQHLPASQSTGLLVLHGGLTFSLLRSEQGLAKLKLFSTGATTAHHASDGGFSGAGVLSDVVGRRNLNHARASSTSTGATSTSGSTSTSTSTSGSGRSRSGGRASSGRGCPHLSLLKPGVFCENPRRRFRGNPRQLEIVVPLAHFSTAAFFPSSRSPRFVRCQGLSLSRRVSKAVSKRHLVVQICALDVLHRQGRLLGRHPTSLKRHQATTSELIRLRPDPCH